MTDTGTTSLPSELDSAASSYLDTFHKHKAVVHLHLQGQLSGDDPSLPSYLPPASYWTSREKDLFFHGLTLFSRLRPDLIATHIKTKNTIEVCLYLQCLETAAADYASDISDTPQRNRTLPAMDVSEKWVEQEESLAQTILSLESCAWRADTDGVQSPSKCFCPSVTTSATDSASLANAYLNHLDSVCLMTQESIIRQPMVEYQDMRLQTHMASVEGIEQAGLSIPNQNRDQGIDQQGHALDPKVSPFTGTESLQNMIEIDESLIDDKLLQRRLKKRLYMRRKRAEKSGRPVDPISIRLRPGRESKVRKPSKPRPQKYKTKNKEEADPNQEDVYEPHTKGGATRPYRIKKIFQENGVDAQMLSHVGIDLFHLLTLTKLLRLYNSLNDCENSLGTESISVRTIQLFGDVAKEFVSEIIRRAIVTKEQEIRMKRTMPVWKYEKEEITVENVAECLYSMGLGHLSHDIEETISPTSANRHPDEVHGEGVNQSLLPTLSKDQLFRTLQHTLPQSMLWCSLPSHRELFATDNILSDEFDSDKVYEELNEDEEFDLQDKKLSADYELSLWNKG